MELDKAATTPQARVIGVKSWTAYAGVAALAALLFFVVLRLAFRYDDLVAAAVLAGSSLIVAYRFLAVRSVQLYYDDVGVWVVSGVLPWQRGVRGVKWRDMDDANYAGGFLAWVTRSYTVRIGHRFTRESEIVLHHMANGRRAVETINAIHQQMIRSGAID
ncbi:hypothetical protein [Massilia sp. BSC265]|uniref:hypothetical protein n=1 Tax=Massilia sp. BSC265 TaxID=1549812 RepID=UPI0004E92A39|nr:hypothetical protein [Massilia sp. BSC265]KFI05377.1 hypothetical protein JN27_23325 [Massilia sp. BSC265]